MEDSQIVLQAKEKLNYSITIYLSNLFEDMQEVVKFHKEALVAEGLYEVPPIDYMKLQRFIVTAVNNLKDRDQAIQSPLFVKLYKDINVLIKFYNLFVKMHHENSAMHIDKFIKHTKAFAEILGHATGEIYCDEVQEALRNTASIKVEGTAKADEFIEYSKHQFEVMFNEKFDELANEMKNIINIKSHMFDKVFWSNARASGSIKNYFSDLGVTGHFNLKTYIQSYLKSVDISKMKDAEWHQYLQNCIKYLG